MLERCRSCVCAESGAFSSCPWLFVLLSAAGLRALRRKGFDFVRSLRFRLAVALLGCAVLGLPTLAHAAIGLTGWSGSGFSGVDNNAGFEFSTTSSINITNLGFFDLSGNGLAASHEVAIWRVSDQSLMVSGTVASGTAAPLDGEYRYVAVTPTVLAAGNYIVSAVTTGDSWLTNLVSPTVSGPLTYVSGRDKFPHETASLTYPNQAVGNKHAPANFKYEAAIGLTGWSGDGFSGVDNNAGFEFSTTSPITITELGFSNRVVGGLAASHEVGIWRVSDQALLVSGTVASGTAAPLDNDYRYVAVTSTLLTTGNYIVSAVTTGEITGWRTNLVAPIMSGPLTYVQPRSIFPAETVSLVFLTQVPGNKHAPANFKYDLAPTPTPTPTAAPTATPTATPIAPTPTAAPTATPTAAPTATPTATPIAPTPTVAPTATPTAVPTATPTATPIAPTPTVAPTATPTATPFSDTDSDGIPDADDNCPFVSNNSQTNSDSLPAGDACQCGDVDGSVGVTLADVTRAQENLLGIPLGGTFDAARCNVIGPSESGVSDCDIADIFILQRFLTGSPVSIGNTCDASSAP